MRVAAWNVRGGRRQEVLEAIAAFEPDIVCLAEVNAGHFIRVAEGLRSQGLAWTASANASGKSILIASALPLVPGLTQNSVDPGRWVQVDLPSARRTPEGGCEQRARTFPNRAHCRWYPSYPSAVAGTRRPAEPAPSSW